MPKASIGGLYAVAKGFNPGIYSSWDDCEQQTKGFPGAKHKKFKNTEEATKWLTTNGVNPKAIQMYASTSTASSSARMDPLARPPPKAETSTAKAKSSGKSSLGNTTIGDPSKYQIVYSDGACRGNGKTGAIAGVGVWWGPDDPRNIAERCPGDQTNNRAELIAMVRVLETVPISKTGILIRTDSKYSIQCFKDWIGNWKKNGWKTASGKAVSNVGIIRYFDALLQERMKAGQTVHLEHVKGHSGDVGNDGADYQANRGCELPLSPDRNWKQLESDARRRIGAAQAYKIREPSPELTIVEPVASSSNAGPSSNGISAEEMQAMVECLTDDIEADLSD